MDTEQRKAMKELGKLTDALVDDIMEASDEEILAEAREDGIDLSDVDRCFARALALAGYRDIEDRLARYGYRPYQLAKAPGPEIKSEDVPF